MKLGDNVEPIFTAGEIDAIVRQNIPDLAIVKYAEGTKPYGYLWGCYESASDGLLFDDPIAALCGALVRTNDALQQLTPEW